MGYATGNQTSHWRCNVRTTVSYPNNSQANVKVDCIFQSCGWAHAINLATCRSSCDGQSQQGSSSVDNRWAGSANWNETVVFSRTFTVSRTNSNRTISSSAYIQNVSGYENGTSSATCTDTINANPDLLYQIPPQISNLKLTRVSDTQLKATWTNNGSGTSAPSANYLDVSVNGDTSWPNKLNTLATSYTWDGTAANGQYQVRVNSYNSAGQNEHVYSNFVYTTPANATISNTVAINTNNNYTVMFTLNRSSIKYPSTKIDFQYSTDGSTWKGAAGAINAVYSITSSSDTVSVSDTTIIDTQFKNALNTLNTGGTVYIRARAYNADNSIPCAYSSSKLTLSKQSQVYIWVPDNTNIANVRVNINIGTANANNVKAYINL